MELQSLCLQNMNPKSLPFFRHSRLNLSQTSIRLLDVLPQQKPGLIRCRIRHVCIPHTRDDLIYTALSYEWGDPAKPLRPIEVEGQKFDIQENLYRFFVDHGQVGISNLWVDALCINQDDIPEKNHQVRHMKDIYEKASKVIIWLGPEEHDSKELFDFLGSSSMRRLDYMAFTNMRAQDDSKLLSIQQEIFSARRTILEAAYQICQRTYWSRTWIVQEVLLGHRIELTCGMKQASWISWVTYIEAFASVPEDTMDSRYWPYRPLILGVRHSPAFTLCGQWQTNTDTAISKQLVSLVLAFAQTECARLHDKVYAFLGLASDAHTFVVDYSLPMEDLLVALLTTIATSTSEDDIFDLCSLFKVSPSLLTLSIDLYTFMAQEDPIYPAFWSELGEKKDPFSIPLEWGKDYRHSFQVSQKVESLLVERSNRLTAKGFVRQYGSLSGFWPANAPDQFKAAILEKAQFQFSLSQRLIVDTRQWTNRGKNSPLVCLCVHCMKLNLVLVNATALTRKGRLHFYIIPIADNIKYRTCFIFFRKEYIATGTQRLMSWHAADNYWSDMTLFYDPVSLNETQGLRSIHLSTRQILNLIAHQNRTHDSVHFSGKLNHFIGTLKIPFCDVEKAWDPTWMQKQLQYRRISEFAPQLVPVDIEGGALGNIHGYDLLFSIRKLEAITFHRKKWDDNLIGDTDDLKPALSWTVKSGWVVVVPPISHMGVSIEAADNYGKTALMYALSSCEDAYIQLLLDKGANIEATDKHGRTALLQACMSIFAVRDTAMQLLIDNGANVEATNNDGQTALIYAIMSGKDTTIQLLLDNGVNIEATDKDGKTALLWLANMDRPAVVNLLLSRAANTEAQDNKGRTPLSHAAQHGNIAVVRLLLAHNASVTAKDKKGRTPLSWVLGDSEEACCVRSHASPFPHPSPFVCQTLQDRWALSEARDRAEVVLLLLEKGARLNVSGGDGKTALMWATEGGCEAITQLLLLKK